MIPVSSAICTRRPSASVPSGRRRTVGPDDVIVCLGDVALRGLFGRRLRRVRASPASLTAIRRLALRIVGGDTVPGRTTAQQLGQVF